MKRAAFAFAVCAYALAVLFFRPHPTPGPPMRDFEAYYAAGAAWNAGDDPYSAGLWRYERGLPGVDPRREGVLPFVNPPPLLPVLGALARLPFPAAAALWAALLGAALLALLWTTRRACGLDGAFAALALIPLALAFGPLSSDLALGQFALVAAAAIAASAFALARGRETAGGLAAVVAALQPTLALALAACARSRRALHAVLAAATVFVLLWIVLAAVAAAPAPSVYAAILREHGAAERYAAIQYAPSAIAYGFGIAAPAASAIGLAIAILAAGGWAAWAVCARPALVPGFAAACALLPFAAPFFHEHDFVLLFLPALYALRGATGGTVRAVAVAGALLCAVDWLGLAQRPDGAAQSLLLLCAYAAALFVAAEREPARGSLVAAAAVAATLAACAFLARAHPAPVWPDAMHGFTAAAGASAAALWHAQQDAARMFVPDPFFAALRTLPLIGCALVAWVIARSARVPSDSRNP